jgi:hypothetical protein
MISGGPIPKEFPGELFVPRTIEAAVERARTIDQPLLVRWTRDTFYTMLIQTQDEINPIEEERLKPELYATVEKAGRFVVVDYVDGRRELI